MSKIPMFPNKFAIFASILGVRIGSLIETYHIPNNLSLFNNVNPFNSGYGVVLRFKCESYCGWLGVEMNSGGYIGNIKYSITVNDAFPDTWKTLSGA